MMLAMQEPVEQNMLANIETEAALLGALMIENGLVDRVADLLTPADFVEPVHGRIYESITIETAAGRAATPVTLRSRFADDPGIAKLGGPSYLAQLTGSGAGLIGYRHFAEQIADLAARRRLCASLTDIIAKVTDYTDQGYRPIAEIVDEADGALVTAAGRRDEARMVDMAQGIKGAIRRIESIVENEGRVGATTGIYDFDAMIGGFEPGQLVIVAGRPGMGKTAVACSFTNGLAQRGHGVFYASLEMSATDISTRMISDAACVAPGQWLPFNNLVEGRLNNADWAVLKATEQHMASWPVRIDDRSAMTLGRLQLGARRAKRSLEAKGQKLSVVIVDYLTLMAPTKAERGMSTNDVVAHFSKGLKALAKDLGVTVIALAQLNRAVEQRDDKRPMLADLRDSGQIEQDADAVVFLYREEYYLAQAKPKPGNEEAHEERVAAAKGKLEMILAKRRNGRTGRVQVQYLAPYQAVRSSDWGRL